MYLIPSISVILFPGRRCARSTKSYRIKVVPIQVIIGGAAALVDVDKDDDDDCFMFKTFKRMGERMEKAKKNVRYPISNTYKFKLITSGITGENCNTQPLRTIYKEQKNCNLVDEPIGN